MKINNIERMFTECVENAIKDGFVINIGSTNFLYDHIMMVDLKKGDQLIRFSVEKDVEYPADNKSVMCKFPVIRFVKYVTTIDGKDVNRTIDSRDMELKDEIVKLFNVSDKRNGEWYVPGNEAVEVANKRKCRCKNRMLHKDSITIYENDEELSTDITKNSDKVKAIVLPIIKRQPRCKSKRIPDIAYVRKNVTVYKGDRTVVTYTVAMKNFDIYTIASVEHLDK